MHIPDGLLDAKICIGAAVISSGVLGYSLHRARKELTDRAAPLMGVTAACLFAAQMLNFPVPGGTSGHLLGGVLAAVMLGPWAGMLVMTVVLLVQCLLFQDGGITALGANVLNVGVIGSVVGFAIYDPLRRLVGGLSGTLAGGVVAAWFSVMLGATLCSLEISLGGPFRLGPALGVMLLVHSMIGVGEALITGLALSFVLRTRPDLIYGQAGGAPLLIRSGQIVLAGLAVAFVFAALLSPFASSLPDGLESSVEKLGLSDTLTSVFSAPFSDLQLAGSVAGSVGTVAVFALAFLLARTWRSNPSSNHISHAN